MTVSDISEATFNVKCTKSRTQAALYKLMELDIVERIEKIPTVVYKTIKFDDRTTKTSIREGSKSDAVVFFRLKK